jgi:hypothetical protein
MMMILGSVHLIFAAIYLKAALVFLDDEVYV